MSEHESSSTPDMGMDAICRFAGHLAHEMNNLLTPIIACGQMLKDGLDKDDPQYFCAEQIFEAGERCLRFSRKLQIIGSRRSNNQVVDLASVVCEAAKSASLPDKGNVRVVLPDVQDASEPSIEGQVAVDMEQLTYLVGEMIQNAAACMPNGGTVELSVSPHGKLEGHEGDHWVCLSIRDEGTGMDEETQARMYEPYFSTEGKERDKGLGLTLVFGIVRRAGGVIVCDSKPGEGTTFRLYFPRSTGVIRE